MMISPTCTYGLGAAAAFLALASKSNVSAFSPAAMAPTRSRGIISPIIGGTNYLSFPPLFASVLSEEQASSPTDKRSSDMSKLDIQQVFEDVDRDGNGTIDFEELEYLLTEYFPGYAQYNMHILSFMVRNLLTPLIPFSFLYHHTLQ